MKYFNVLLNKAFHRCQIMRPQVFCDWVTSKRKIKMPLIHCLHLIKYVMPLLHISVKNGANFLASFVDEFREYEVETRKNGLFVSTILTRFMFSFACPTVIHTLAYTHT